MSVRLTRERSRVRAPLLPLMYMPPGHVSGAIFRAECAHFVQWLLEEQKKQMTGIEPASPAWEAGVLPMNYACKSTQLIIADTLQDLNSFVQIPWL